MAINVVGIGPGDKEHLTLKAKEVIENSDVIVGYTAYIEFIDDLINGKEIIKTGMKGEIERCRKAFEESLKGKEVSIISSGDSGIYGMASLIYELSEKYPKIEINIIPGITAASSSAAVLGAPISNDFVCISLSDLLTPWEIIEKRLEAASLGDFVICIYNPSSIKRGEYLKRACEIILKYKPPETNCGYVRNALRGENQEYNICTLEELQNKKVDMFTTVIIGNSQTKVIDNKLVTLRGYKL